MPPKKVLIISIDNLRYDCTGYAEGKQSAADTPVLDEIARRGAVFTNCFSTNSYTTAAHASLFTGLLPPEHGLRPFYHIKLRNDCKTLAEIYKDNGYKTVFCSDLPELFEPTGLTRGFDYKITRDDVNLFKVLSDLKDENTFCFIHLLDVHFPYIYSECPINDGYNNDYFDFIKKLSARFNIKLESKEPHKMFLELTKRIGHKIEYFLPPYIYGVNKFDKGRFKLYYESLRDIGYFDEDNIYAILSDHGEGRMELSDQSSFNHGGEVYDEIIHIPLIFHAPGIAGKIYDNLVSIADIYPTALFYSGLNADYALLDGRSLFKQRDFCYSEFYVTKVSDDKAFGTAAAAAFAAASEGMLPLFSGVLFSLKDEYFLFQRSIRTLNKKYMFIGNFFDVDELNRIIENPGISDEEYIAFLYRFVLARFEDGEGFLFNLKNLKEKKISRAGLYEQFISSSEFINDRPRIYYYDLINDPDEKNPVVLDPASGEISFYINFLKKLEQNAVVTDDIFAGEAAVKVPAASNEIDLLNSKVSLSIEIIREAYDRYGDKIGIAFTGGKDSSTLLDLVRKTFNGKIPFKVITIDTSAEFPEIKEFIERLKTEWGFELLTYSNTEALKQNYPVAKDKADCCNTLKTSPLKQSVKDLRLKALFTGIRKDETEARANETYFSKRKDPHHFRVHPLLHFTEKDIWDYIKLNNLPYCSLYEQGYRSIDCAPCTQKTAKDAAIAERSGRSPDKEAAMDKLRKLGYF